MRFRISIVFGLLSIFGGSASSNAADFAVAINQAFVDRAVGDTTLPIVAVDKDTPCDIGNLQKPQNPPPLHATAAYLVEQSHQSGAGPWAREIQEWETHIRAEIASVEQNRKSVIAAGKKWEGPSEQELADYKKLQFPVTACVEHLRITMDRRPGLAIMPPGVQVNIPDISAHAKVQVFVWNPFHSCNNQVCIGNFCVCYSWNPGWDPLGGGFDLGTDHATADGTLAVRVASPLVLFDPSLSRLRFAPPWDWIPLEGIANWLMAPIKALDLRDIKVTIDPLGENYIGDTATASVVTGMIRLDVRLKRVP